MKFLLTKTALALGVVLSLSACSNLDSTTSEVAKVAANAASASLQQVNKSVDTVQQGKEALAQQLVDATAWVQTSGEYRALAYQAFNYAKLAFDTAKPTKGKLKAVVVDLDETMIDNSDFQGSLIHNNESFSSENWGNWEQNGNPRLIPGALEFAKYVNSHGGKMYYVSNRSDKNKQYTIASLKKLGFPGADDTTVLLRDKVSDKNIRFDAIAKENPIVLWIGDNLNDLPGVYQLKDAQKRADWSTQNADKFGVKYIVLPNPMYGDWLSTLAPNWWNYSDLERSKIIQDKISKWEGFKK